MAEIAISATGDRALPNGITVGVTPTKAGRRYIVHLMLGAYVARSRLSAAECALAASSDTALRSPGAGVKI